MNNFIELERKTHYPWVVGYKRSLNSIFYQNNVFQ